MLQFREFHRVINLAQLLFLVGKRLVKLGFKYTIASSVIVFWALLVDVLGADLLGRFFGESPRLKAALVPGVVALFTIGLGHTLIGISNLFSSERILLADANAMNQLEDRKKARVRHHLEVLWDRVYRYETRLRYDGSAQEHEQQRIVEARQGLREWIDRLEPRLQEHFGIARENKEDFVLHVAAFAPLSDELQRSREGFLVSAEFAVQNDLSQKLQRAISGVDLSLLEDWYDGAYFNINDCKLKQQFAAHNTLRAIRRQVGLSWQTRVREALSGYPNPMWYTLTMNKLAMQAGTLINRFNEKYVTEHEPPYFDAQDFLWPVEEEDRLFRERFSQQGEQVLNDLRQARQQLIRGIFSNSPYRAAAHLLRMFGKDFRNAFKLRIQVDAPFCGGVLAENPVSELENLQDVLQHVIFSHRQARRAFNRGQERLKQTDSFVQHYLPHVWRDPLLLRAVRTGLFMNQGNTLTTMGQDPAAATRLVNETIVPAAAKWNEKIQCLRVHYELTRLQLLDYWEMIREQGQYPVANTLATRNVAE